MLAVSAQTEWQRRLSQAGISPAAMASVPTKESFRLVLVSGLLASEAARLAEVATGKGVPALVQDPLSATKHRSLALIGSPVMLKALVRSGTMPPSAVAELILLLDREGQRPTRLIGRNRTLSLERPRIMGILNVTPDSFYANSRQVDFDEALRQGVRLATEGADLIDVGGESTRPGAEAVDLEHELDRVVPVIERLSREVDCPLSVDTNKSQIAAAAVAAGADFVNDISGLQFDSKMASAVADSGAGLFLMHTRGRPKQMQQDTHYQDLLADIVAYLETAVDQALAAGIDEESLAIDPGIGFGKSAEGNLQVLNRLSELHGLGCPLLLGTSRKGFIGRVLGLEDPALRLAGTLATISLGVAAGAQIFRVHDVKPAREAALMAWAICHEQLP